MPSIVTAHRDQDLLLVVDRTRLGAEPPLKPGSSGVPARSSYVTLLADNRAIAVTGISRFWAKKHNKEIDLFDLSLERMKFEANLERAADGVWILFEGLADDCVTHASDTLVDDDIDGETPLVAAVLAGWDSDGQPCLRRAAIEWDGASARHTHEELNRAFAPEELFVGLEATTTQAASLDSSDEAVRLIAESMWSGHSVIADRERQLTGEPGSPIPTEIDVLIFEPGGLARYEVLTP